MLISDWKCVRTFIRFKHCVLKFDKKVLARNGTSTVAMTRPEGLSTSATFSSGLGRDERFATNDLPAFSDPVSFARARPDFLLGLASDPPGSFPLGWFHTGPQASSFKPQA